MNTLDYEELDELEWKVPRKQRQRREISRIKKNAGAEQHVDYFSQIDFDNVEDYSLFDFFIGEGIIRDKGPVLKQGKEACVYRCPGQGDKASVDVAIKAYKNIEHRSFQSLSSYLQGRLAEAGISRRDAMHILSTPSELQAFWVYSEYSVMERLYQANIPVPVPYAKSSTALAMEFIYEESGGSTTAPRLRDVQVNGDTKRIMKEILLDAIERMLHLNIIHGDLSPYNILVRDNLPVIIDFPQAVDARYNERARPMLERDIRSICRHFPDPAIPPDQEASLMAAKLWKRYD